MFTSAELEETLRGLIEKYDVPGAQLAVLDGDELVEVAAGVLSLRTRWPVTTDALFLPGSIGKLYTATLAMMLVGTGELDLEVPIRRYLPGFRVRDVHARDVVTPRHLLSHVSGFDGDRFTDTGRGADALWRYVSGCADLPQIADPGRIWSYSNSGYAILGRIVEVITGQTFEDVLRERIFEPLELQHTVSFADEAIVHPASVGHIPDPKDPSTLIVSPTWTMARAFGPMGTAVIASAGDVLRFAGAHLEHLDNGKPRLLDASLVEAMQREQVRLVDDSILGEAWGLGWILDNWGGIAIIGHDGNSLGQNAFMRLAPAEGFGFCLQTNVESALNLYRELAAWLFGKRLGVGPRSDPAALPQPSVGHPERYVGRYEREGLVIDVSADDGATLRATVESTHAVAESQDWPPMVNLPLQPVTREDSFLLKLPIADADLLAVFFNPDHPGAEPSYVHYGGRAHRRVNH